MQREGIASIQQIERGRKAVLELLKYSSSNKIRLIELTDYLYNLLAIQNNSIREAYITEVIEDFFQLLDMHIPFCLSPASTEKIIDTAGRLSKIDFLLTYNSRIEESLNTVNIKYAELKNILEGKSPAETGNKIYFPVLEQPDKPDGIDSAGFLESASIHIRKSENKTTFRLIPGEINKDNLIEQQLVTSWDLALKKAKPFIKKAEKHHEVFIHFDNATGYYRGNSLSLPILVREK